MHIGFNDQIIELNKKIEKTNHQLLLLLIEQADLIKKAVIIKAEYILKIGKYEIEHYRLYFEYLKLIRQISIYQAAINRQETIDNKSVIALIEKETAEYQKKLNDLLEDYNIATIIKNSPRLDLESIYKVREIYRYVAKKIHPDLNPNLPDEFHTLWLMTQEAYNNNDLEKLEMLKQVLESKNIQTTTQTKIEQLRHNLITVEKRIEKIIYEITQIRQNFPFNKVEILKDEKKVNDIVSDLKNDIKLYQEYNQKLKEKLEMMMPTDVVC